MSSDIGEFLRSRRARIRPESVGFTADTTPRRVPGLRREEVAQLAGVSVDYYVRLEQGRSRRVSDAVLDAVARVLDLDGIEREHLGNLARSPAAPSTRGRSRPTRLSARLRPQAASHLERLMDSMISAPALMLGRGMEVLAWNASAEAVFEVSAMAAMDWNAARHVFLAPQARTLYRNWETMAAEVVAELRLDVGRHVGDPRLSALVGELSIASADFRRLWATQDVAQKTVGSAVVAHPLVGEMTFEYQALAVRAAPELTLMTYASQADTPSWERLQLLLSWTSDDTDNSAGSTGRRSERSARTSGVEEER